MIAARACKDDVPKVCKDVTDTSPGSVLACLRYLIEAISAMPCMNVLLES